MLVRTVVLRGLLTAMRHRMIALALPLVLAAAACTDSPDQSAGESARFTLSYAGAASRLAGLDNVEAPAQLMDWARFGLAAHLKLDTARARDAFYDTLPVRDAGFAELARQSSGPGRTLFEGGVLHVLVAPDDPHRARTIGQLLDQHRTDAGTDPQQVRLHDVVVRPDTRTIEITSAEAKPAADVRSAHGYVSKRVDDVGGLRDFLAQTRYLSTLEVRGPEIWAGGWNWEDGRGLDLQDVSVLQRGYEKSTGPKPGFSLDAGKTKTVDDVRAVLPGLDPAHANGPLTGVWDGLSPDEIAAVAEAALHGNANAQSLLAQAGLPADRAQLWAILQATDQNPLYSMARYDGGLAGTEIGMTLFYTDFVAKDWANGVGTGVPAKAVEGFDPDPEAATPWSHCPSPDDDTNESGRLWFGQNESAFSFDDKQIRVGAQSTRLFARSDGDGGGEVEPTYSFGRGLRWWDQHYQAVADYEPQYQRLDQIMRWSGALEWLNAKTSARLPKLPDGEIISNLKFRDWYKNNNALKERGEIRFVAPPSAAEESILALPSKSFRDCGYPWISGGVSLADMIDRMGGRSYRANLSESMNRAGPVDESSSVNGGSGTIQRKSFDSKGDVVDQQRYEFTTTDGKAVVESSSPGRRVIGFGALKQSQPESTPRRFTTEISAEDGTVTQKFRYQGHELGQLKATSADGQTVVTWHRGLVDRARSVLESLQNRLVAKPSEGVPVARDGVFYRMIDGDGRVLNRIGGAEAEWIAISSDLPPPSAGLTFRIGAPSPGTGQPRFYYGSLVKGPDGPAGGWLDVAPATGDHPAIATFAQRPAESNVVKVTTRDGRNADAHVVGDHVRVPINDPLLGVHGSPEGAALLANFPRVTAAMKEPVQGAQHVLRLGDEGAALVGTEVTLLPPTDGWGARVLRLVDNEASRTYLARLKDDNMILIDRTELKNPSGVQRMNLSQVAETVADPYLHESFRHRLGLVDGKVTRDALKRDEKVRVRQYELVHVIPATATRADFAEIRSHGRAEWLRVNGNASGGQPPSSPPNPPPGTPGGSGWPGLVPHPTTITLVCPDNDEQLAECGDW